MSKFKPTSYLPGAEPATESPHPIHHPKVPDMIGNDDRKHRIFALWNQYRTAIIPAAAGANQVRECRRAFYAGVESTLNRLAAEMSEGPGVDDPHDLGTILDVQQELREFARDVQEGRA